MCQPIDKLNRTVDMFNDYNTSLRLKAMCTLDVIENFKHVEEDFQKLKFKIS